MCAVRLFSTTIRKQNLENFRTCFLNHGSLLTKNIIHGLLEKSFFSYPYLGKFVGRNVVAVVVGHEEVGVEAQNGFEFDLQRKREKMKAKRKNQFHAFRQMFDKMMSKDSE